MIQIHPSEPAPFEAAIGTMGFFDGVHKGHLFVLRALQQQAVSQGVPSVVITFWPHPREILQAEYQPQLLEPLTQKLDHIAQTGIDYCLVLDFTVALSQLSAEQFLQQILYDRWNIRTLLLGYNHRFGNQELPNISIDNPDRAHQVKLLRLPVYQSLEPISSSRIRKALQDGRAEQANKMLGHPYAISGTVQHGKKIGRQMGFPTANIRPLEKKQLLPASGVYAVWVYVQGERYQGMLNIGTKPTVSHINEITLEVHIIGFDYDLYGQIITLELISRIRDEERFDTLEELQQQICLDQARIVKLLSVS